MLRIHPKMRIWSARKKRKVIPGKRERMIQKEVKRILRLFLKATCHMSLKFRFRFCHIF